jgi:hypothetical protein
VVLGVRSWTLIYRVVSSVLFGSVSFSVEALKPSFLPNTELWTPRFGPVISMQRRRDVQFSVMFFIEGNEQSSLHYTQM